MKKEEFEKFYSKYKLYIFPSVVALSSLILIVFVIFPQMTKLIANQRVEKEIQNKSKLLEVKAKELETYDLSELDRKVNFAVGSLPTDRDSVYAMGLLQRLISQFGFTTVSMSLGSGFSKNANTQSYNFNVDLVGPINLLPSLLSNIENSPRLMKVNSVDVGVALGSSGGSVSLSVDVLYAAAPQGFGTVDSPLPSLSEKDEEIITRLARSGVSTPESQAATPIGARGKANPFE